MEPKPTIQRIIERIKVWAHNFGCRNTKRALRDLSKALQNSPDYAHSWQCNIACCLMDTGIGHKSANKAADRVMKHCFGVDAGLARLLIDRLPVRARTFMSDTDNTKQGVTQSATQNEGGIRFLLTETQCADLEKRFTYHAPSGSQPECYVALRNKAKELAFLIAQTTHASREQSLALTSLEESVFWANAAIARNG
jgi:hypothetical protein